MKITLEENKDSVVRVFSGDNFVGIMKSSDGHLLCYSKGRHTTTQNLRHTTTQNLREVIRFFNGDYGSYYYRGNDR